MSLSVVIPSRNVMNLIVCVEAVFRHEPGARVIVVDDGLDHEELIATGLVSGWAAGHFVQGAKPFVFARNVNIGIRAALAGAYRDVVILNDDAVLESPGGFSIMREAAELHSFALVSATTNLAASPFQLQTTSGGVRVARKFGANTFPAVAFVCVLIPGRTIEAIGILDERFTAYGWEDIDYCRRIHDAGRTIGIDDRCFVDHGRLTSTFRGDPRAAGPIAEGKAIYLNKWGKL
jgi:GT2 family glycosyltransferase